MVIYLPGWFGTAEIVAEKTVFSSLRFGSVDSGEVIGEKVDGSEFADGPHDCKASE
jgi:hypothetical protein